MHSWSGRLRGEVGTNLVGLVVELLVILLDLGLLGVFPGRNEFVELSLLSPLLAVDEPSMVSSWLLFWGLGICFHTSASPEQHRTSGLGGIAAVICVSGRTVNSIGSRVLSYQSQGVKALSVAFRLQHHAQLMHLGNLLLGQEARMAILLLGRRIGEVIVVVFRVQIHGGV